jgi:PTS system ascorbate-specific IIA component
MITGLLKENTVKVNLEVNTWEEAAWASGGLLVETGGVEARYIEAMMLSVKTYGPYIVIVPGIAIFHGRPQDGVNRICMSLVTLKNPVNFDAGEKDPVKLVFAFGAIDNKAHIEALADLMVLFQDEEVLLKIQEAQTKEEVLKIIKIKLGEN